MIICLQANSYFFAYSILPPFICVYLNISTFFAFPRLFILDANPVGRHKICPYLRLLFLYLYFSFIYFFTNDYSLTTNDYSTISLTTPALIVLPPSRIAKRRPFSMAIGVINSPLIVILSPGITISTPSGSSTVPVTSVVLK